MWVLDSIRLKAGSAALPNLALALGSPTSQNLAGESEWVAPRWPAQIPFGWINPAWLPPVQGMAVGFWGYLPGQSQPWRSSLYWDAVRAGTVLGAGETHGWAYADNISQLSWWNTLLGNMGAMGQWREVSSLPTLPEASPPPAPGPIPDGALPIPIIRYPQDLPDDELVAACRAGNLEACNEWTRRIGALEIDPIPPKTNPTSNPMADPTTTTPQTSDTSDVLGMLGSAFTEVQRILNQINPAPDTTKTVQDQKPAPPKSAGFSLDDPTMQIGLGILLLLVLSGKLKF